MSIDLLFGCIHYLFYFLYLFSFLFAGCFDPEKTVSGVGWLKALRETKEFGVGSFVYRKRRPFNPGR